MTPTSMSLKPQKGPPLCRSSLGFQKRPFSLSLPKAPWDCFKVQLGPFWTAPDSKLGSKKRSADQTKHRLDQTFLFRLLAAPRSRRKKKSKSSPLGGSFRPKAPPFYGARRNNRQKKPQNQRCFFCASYQKPRKKKMF